MNNLKIPHIVGQQAQDFAKEWFKAQDSNCAVYDLETEKYLIEVKSCNLFNRNKGSYSKNSSRKFQLGRFYIKTDNHLLFWFKGLELNKSPVYCFILRIGNHQIIKTMKWEEVLVYNQNYNHFSIFEVFADVV